MLSVVQASPLAREADQNAEKLTQFLPLKQQTGYITREKWQRIYESIYRRNSRLGSRENRLTLSEVQSIMGFRGQQLERSGVMEKWLWQDFNDPRTKIEGIFVNGFLHDVRATNL
ncbi:MAG: hypothetical protein ACOC0N_07615 [Chroococcales cyanobacterium]